MKRHAFYFALFSVTALAASAPAQVAGIVLSFSVHA